MIWRVVVADKLAESGLRLLGATPELEVVNVAGKPREDLDRALAGAHALIVRSETRVTVDLMNRAPHLKLIARAGIGVDTIDVHAATRRGVAVMNAPGANTVSAAEHAMGLLLSLVRHIPGAADAMRRGDWDRKRFEGTELRGKTIGVVGLGRIGGHVAQLARAFGMTVVAHDPYVTPERAGELQVRMLPLEQLLQVADVVTLHVALTDQTRHLINAQRLSLMKPKAVLLNTARGELVDEAALVEAVTLQRIAGAAIDVFAQERVGVEIGTAVRDALLHGDFSTAVNVPGITADVLRRLGPLLDLARRLGRLAVALADGPVRAVEVAYGGRDEGAPRPVLSAALEGLLSAQDAGPVSLVNALLLAEERGIQLARKTGAPEAGFETSVGVTVDAAGGRVRVAGALAGN
ncbi:MAG: phosphoglycerate dehydrogenase, partial [Gemmatimonadetes bacterium]